MSLQWEQQSQQREESPPLLTGSRRESGDLNVSFREVYDRRGKKCLKNHSLRVINIDYQAYCKTVSTTLEETCSFQFFYVTSVVDKLKALT